MNPKNHREKIVRAATDLFYRYGYHATSVGDIARAASVPKGSLYNHFRGKSDLAAHVVDSFAKRAIEDLRAVIGPGPEAPSRAVERLLDACIRDHRANGYRYGCSLGSRLNELAETDLGLSRRISAHLDSWASVLEERFREWGERNSRRDIARAAPRIARTVQAAIQGALLQMKGSRDPAPLEAARDTLGMLLETYERAKVDGRRGSGPA